MKFKFIFAAILFSFFCTAVSAQTQAEMEMIRQMAKQRGYSDAQIEEMMSKYTGGGSSASSMLDTTSVVDRNQMNPLLIRPETQNQMQLLMMQMQQRFAGKGKRDFRPFRFLKAVRPISCRVITSLLLKITDSLQEMKS